MRCRDGFTNNMTIWDINRMLMEWLLELRLQEKCSAHTHTHTHTSKNIAGFDFTAGSNTHVVAVVTVFLCAPTRRRMGFALDDYRGPRAATDNRLGLELLALRFPRNGLSF